MSKSFTFSNNYFEDLIHPISKLDCEAIGKFSDLLLESKEKQSTIFLVEYYFGEKFLNA